MQDLFKVKYIYQTICMVNQSIIKYLESLKNYKEIMYKKFYRLLKNKYLYKNLKIFYFTNILFYLKYFIVFFLVKLFKNNYSLKRKELFNFFLNFNQKNQLGSLIVYSDPEKAAKFFLKNKKKVIYYSQNYVCSRNFIFNQ